MHRCVVVPAAAASASSIHGTLHDANGRPWPAGPAREPPSTGATPVASTARVDGQTGGSVDPNGREHPADDAGQESRGRGPHAWTGPTGAPRPSGRPHSSAVVDWLPPPQRPPLGWRVAQNELCRRAHVSALSGTRRRRGPSNLARRRTHARFLSFGDPISPSGLRPLILRRGIAIGKLWVPPCATRSYTALASRKLPSLLASTVRLSATLGILATYRRFGSACLAASSPRKKRDPRLAPLRGSC